MSFQITYLQCLYRAGSLWSQTVSYVKFVTYSWTLIEVLSAKPPATKVAINNKENIIPK